MQNIVLAVGSGKKKKRLKNVLLDCLGCGQT